jgi:4-methyl-5(b-hydroxyethyl)-thiazole monophosphate biosynthesis
MNKAAVFFAEGFEEIEALTVVDLLRRAEVETLMVSITPEQYVEGSHGITVKTDLSFDDLDFNAVEMIILPGGRGHTNLEACKPLMDKVDEFHRLQKPIAAICAAPAILGRRGILEGRCACSFPTVERDLLGAKIMKKPAVIDGHIITGRGMGASIEFGLEVVTYFCGIEAAEQLAEKICFFPKIVI